jgi:hypothetical protein
MELGGKTEYSKKKHALVPLVHQKFGMGWPGIEPGLRGDRPATRNKKKIPH